MNNELEKQFFEIFGIKPKKGCTAYDEFTEEEADVICNDKCAECSYLDDVYPQITDHILLELIFLQPLSIEFKYPRNIKELKNTLLGYYIEELSLFAEPSEAEIFKQQVRTLFEK